MTTVVKEFLDKVEELKPSGEERAAPLPVVFVVMQTGNRANGGVESITQVIERLRRVQPVVLTQMETPVNRRWREAGCEVHVWPEGRGRAASIARFNRRVYKLLRARGLRVVHCNDILALWHAGFGARAAGASVLFNVRNVKPTGQKYGWHWRVARRLSHRHLALSREMRDALSARLDLPARAGGVNGNHHGAVKNGGGNVGRGVEFIYSIADPQRLSPAGALEREELRQQLGIERECFAVGFVAAFDPRKAQLDLIREAGPRLKQTVPRAKLYFVGDFDPGRNAYARLCREAVRAAGLDASVSFVGYSAEVADWYRALDAVVVTSRNEGLARCMIEGLACGTPVVSFDVCSAREILEEGACGAVVAQGDYEALVEELARLAGDERARRELGGRGAALARELFDPRAVVRRYEELYLSLAGV